MGLEKITHIEGLDEDQFQDIELHNDTNPGATLVSFSVEAVEMPALSKIEKRIVKKPFVFITKIMNLGNAVLHRRVRDHVELDEATGKWKIIELVKGVNASDGSPRSDIKRYSAEWNAFMRGVAYNDIGTPLEILFKADPARAEYYKSRHIRTVEMLSNLTQTHIDDLGLGARADVNKAKAYMEEVKAASDTSYFHNELEKKDAQIEELMRHLRELQLRVEDVETVKVKAKAPKKKAKQEFNEENIEGL